VSDGRAELSVRVEHAQQVLPDVDTIAPLRALLIVSSRLSSGNTPHATVGKRAVQPAKLRELIPEAIARFSAHLTAVSELAVEALDAESHGNLSAAVDAFLKASALEVENSRELAATTWLKHALGLAEAAPDRRGEIEVLLALGELKLTRGQLERAARRAQRAYTIAAAVDDDDMAAKACHLLGRVALSDEDFLGARSWLARGLSLAPDTGLLRARLEQTMGEALARRGDYNDAMARLQAAEDAFRAAEDRAGVASALAARARVVAAAGQSDDALVLLREALVVARKVDAQPRDGRVELGIRIRLSRHLLERNELRDAEDQARRAEELAIVHNHAQELARIYLLLGAIRTAERDETGMVFFEKALELSRDPLPLVRLEADAYREYARFCFAVGQEEEATAYLERERELRDQVVIEART
jgi:tetratricopeptide (TPR) repeat protein